MTNFNYTAKTIELSNLKTNKISIFTKMNSYNTPLTSSFPQKKAMLLKSFNGNTHYKALIRAFLMKNGKSKVMQSNSHKAALPLNVRYPQLNFVSAPKIIFESYASPFGYVIKKSSYNRRKNLGTPKWYSSLKEQKMIFSFFKEFLRAPSKKSLSKSLHINIFTLASHKSKLSELQLEKQQQSTDLWIKNSVSFRSQKSSEKKPEDIFLSNFSSFYTPKKNLKSYSNLKSNILIPDQTNHNRITSFNKDGKKRTSTNSTISFRTLQGHRLNISLMRPIKLGRMWFSPQKGSYLDSISWFNSKKTSSSVQERALKKLKRSGTKFLINSDAFKQKTYRDSTKLKIMIAEKDFLTKFRPKINQKLENIGFFPLSDRIDRTTSLDFQSYKKGKKYSWALEKGVLNWLLSSALGRNKTHPFLKKKGRYSLLKSRKNSLKLSVKNLDSLTFFDSIQKHRKYSRYPSGPFFMNQRIRQFISLKHTQVLKNKVFNTLNLSNTLSSRLLLFDLKPKQNIVPLTLRFDLIGWNSSSFQNFASRLKQRLNSLRSGGHFKISEKPVQRRIKRTTLLKSPHVNKKSQQHFDKVEYSKTVIVICEFGKTFPSEKINSERVRVLISSVIRQTAGVKLKISFT